MLLNVLTALYSTSNCVISRLLPVGQFSIDGWPHDNHSITNEFDDVASILVQVGDHAFHVAIDAKGKLLVPSGPLLLARLAQVCETGDVRKDDHGLHGLQLGEFGRLVRRLVSHDELLEDETWDVLV